MFFEKKAFLLFTALSVSAWAAGAPLVKEMRITKQIPGYHDQGKLFQAFAPQKLYEIINGAAPPYINGGLVSGIHQQLNADSGRTIEIFAEDFATAEKAGAMYRLKRSDFPYTVPVENEDTAAVIAAPAIGALVVVCTIDRFYFEITISGFAEQADAEKQAAALISVYKNKIPRNYSTRPLNPPLGGLVKN
jgi:hypothetical protein